MLERKFITLNKKSVSQLMKCHWILPFQHRKAYFHFILRVIVLVIFSTILINYNKKQQEKISSVLISFV